MSKSVSTNTHGGYSTQEGWTCPRSRVRWLGQPLPTQVCQLISQLACCSTLHSLGSIQWSTSHLLSFSLPLTGHAPAISSLLMPNSIQTAGRTNIRMNRKTRHPPPRISAHTPCQPGGTELCPEPSFGKAAPGTRLSMHERAHEALTPHGLASADVR